MLRRRLKKLELQKPRSPGDLIAQWDHRALSLLSIQERELVKQDGHCRSHRRVMADALVAAEQHYQQNLANLIQEVSDLELDQKLAFFGVPARVAQ